MREIYLTFAQDYLKQSLWTIHIAFFVLLIGLFGHVPYVLWISTPFLGISLLSVSKLYVYKKRAIPQVGKDNSREETVEFENDLILLREGDVVHLLNPKGNSRGYIRNRGQSIFTLYNERNFPLLSFGKSENSNSIISIRNQRNQLSAIFYEMDFNPWVFENAKLVVKNESYEMKKKDFQRFIIKSKLDEVIVTVQKGWMPLQWQQRFPANAPIITFEKEVTQENREIFLLIVGYILLQ